MNEKEIKRMQHEFKPKNWTQTKAHDSWSVFKIMAEVVDGYEELARIGPCVAVFGSARTKETDKYYKAAEELAYLLTKKGFCIITGGGPGIMEAANKGAHFAGGKSVGLNINLPFEQRANVFIDPDKLNWFLLLLVIINVGACTKNDPQSQNQRVRWIMNKEKHAQNIISSICDYFLTQRVKPNQKDYAERLLKHHAVIIAAMKTKQNADMKYTKALKDSIEALSPYYPENKQ